MRIDTRLFISLAAAGILLTVANFGMAAETNASKEKTVDPVKQCQAGCKVHKDNESYEACMIKCKEANKKTNPAGTTRK